MRATLRPAAAFLHGTPVMHREALNGPTDRSNAEPGGKIPRRPLLGEEPGTLQGARLSGQLPAGVQVLPALLPRSVGPPC